MDRETHEIRLANWKALIEQCQAGAVKIYAQI